MFLWPTAPRPTLLTYNAKDDCCFESGYALKPLVDAAAPVFRLFDSSSALRTHVNEDPGTHNYELDNRQALYRMLGDFFFRPFQLSQLPLDRFNGILHHAIAQHISLRLQSLDRLVQPVNLDPV